MQLEHLPGTAVSYNKILNYLGKKKYTNIRHQKFKSSEAKWNLQLPNLELEHY